MSTMERITMAHGSGGEATGRLIEEVFAKAFDNSYLAGMEDSTIVPGADRIAVTTDSFVVTPYFYPGGNIGKLSVCGTVNDLLMSGSVPKYITCGYILEEGLLVEDLITIVKSMADTAKEAGVMIVAGDTKVVEGRTPSGGLLINTAGVGVVEDGFACSSTNIKPGDVVLCSGMLGDHHAAILGKRMGITNSIVSDQAPLNQMVAALRSHKVKVHAMRDVTRGGLATVLHEFSQAAKVSIVIEESALPVREEVKGFCGILGLDPLYMGNEGKMVAIVDPADAELALSLMKKSDYGQDAAEIGVVANVPNGANAPNGANGRLSMHTVIGGERVLGPLYGEGLPRIC